jgi:hypothetical protein
VVVLFPLEDAAVLVLDWGLLSSFALSALAFCAASFSPSSRPF